MADKMHNDFSVQTSLKTCRTWTKVQSPL